MITFKASTKSLIEILKKAKVAVGKMSKTSKQISTELTITDNKLTVVVPGANFSLEGETMGTCKASVSFFHFYQIVKDCKEKKVEILIESTTLTIGNVSISIRTTFFEDDSILRSIDLPMNYTDVDLMKLPLANYTYEELKFNKLIDKIRAAEVRLDDNMWSAYSKIREYGISYDELELLVKNKILSRHK